MQERMQERMHLGGSGGPFDPFGGRGGRMGRSGGGSGSGSKDGASSLEFVPRMMSTLGRSGKVIEIDMSQIDQPLLLLEFYDPESLQLSQWWYTLKALCSPPATNSDVGALQLYDKEEEEDGEEEEEREEEEQQLEQQEKQEEERGSSCEIALGRMYAQRLLLESWSQARERAITLEEKEALVLDSHFFTLAVNDAISASIVEEDLALLSSCCCREAIVAPPTSTSLASSSFAVADEPRAILSVAISASSARDEPAPSASCCESCCCSDAIYKPSSTNTCA